MLNFTSVGTRGVISWTFDRTALHKLPLRYQSADYGHYRCEGSEIRLIEIVVSRHTPVELLTKLTKLTKLLNAYMKNHDATLASPVPFDQLPGATNALSDWGDFIFAPTVARSKPRDSSAMPQIYSIHSVSYQVRRWRQWSCDLKHMTEENTSI